MSQPQMFHDGCSFFPFLRLRWPVLAVIRSYLGVLYSYCARGSASRFVLRPAFRNGESFQPDCASHVRVTSPSFASGGGKEVRPSKTLLRLREEGVVCFLIYISSRKGGGNGIDDNS